MQPLRTATRAARHLKIPLQRQSRRHASDHGHGHGSHQPVNENFGSGFYIALAAIPLSLALYKFSRQGTDEQPYFTRLIRDTYAGYKKKWADRNDLHTQAMEQAAADRVLFLNESESHHPRTVDLRFPEQFNVGSPWNVHVGHNSANIDELIEKYRKESFADNEKRLQQLREDNVPVEKPYKSFTKITPAAKDS